MVALPGTLDIRLRPAFCNAIQALCSRGNLSKSITLLNIGASAINVDDFAAIVKLAQYVNFQWVCMVKMSLVHSPFPQINEPPTV